MTKSLLGKTLMHTRLAERRLSPYIGRTKHLDREISWNLIT